VALPSVAQPSVAQPLGSTIEQRASDAKAIAVQKAFSDKEWARITSH